MSLTPNWPISTIYDLLGGIVSLPKKVGELKEVILGSWSYLVEHEPPKITAPHSTGSRRLYIQTSKFFLKFFDAF